MISCSLRFPVVELVYTTRAAGHDDGNECTNIRRLVFSSLPPCSLIEFEEGARAAASSGSLARG